MEENYNPYIRLQAYLTFLANEGDLDTEVEYGSTIRLLAEKTAIPVEIVRTDIANIMAYNIGIAVVPDYDCAAYAKLDAKYQLGDDNIPWQELEKQAARIVELIRSGEFDDVILTYTAKDDAKYIVQLTPEEYRAITSLGKVGKEKYLLPFLVKDSFRFKNNQGSDKWFRIICNALEQGDCLCIEYKSNKGKIHQDKLRPVKIVYDSVDNEYALVTIFKHAVKVYRLQNIRKAMVIKETITIPEDDMHLLDNIDQVWGLEFMDKPRKVKVRFYNIGNVWEKVRRDLSYRSQGKLYEENGYLYYEDTVYGLYSFRSWIFGYGAAAIVEEPAELRESIINSLQQRKAENEL